MIVSAINPYTKSAIRYINKTKPNKAIQNQIQQGATTPNTIESGVSKIYQEARKRMTAFKETVANPSTSSASKPNI